MRNVGGGPSADLVLNADAALDGGSICASRNDGGPADDQPNIHINQDFTIGAGAAALWHTCSAFGIRVHVNGPDGHLTKVGAGTSTSNGGLDVAGGTLTVGSGQSFVFNGNYQQTGGLTDIASGGALQVSPAVTGGVFRGAGQVTGNLTNTSGTVRPGTSPGTLTVTGDYTQGANGVLEVDVDGTAQGTQYDHLDVGGAASLDGTVAVVKGAGFDPLLSDTFQFLSSASRSGTFDALVGSRLASGEGYVLDYPGAPDFGARLTVTGPPARSASRRSPTPTPTRPPTTARRASWALRHRARPSRSIRRRTAAARRPRWAAPPTSPRPACRSRWPTSRRRHSAPRPARGPTLGLLGIILAYTDVEDLVVTDCDDPQLATVTSVSGDLVANNLPACATLSLPNLTDVGGAINVNDNQVAGSIDLGSITSTTGSVTMSGNEVGSIDLGSITSVTGSIDISDNGDAKAELGSLADVGGDLRVESTGTGAFDPGPVSPDGDTDISTEGYDSSSGTTAAGETAVENGRSEATVSAELPTGAFSSPVEFTITRLDPATLAPTNGTAPSGLPTVVDPVAAYEFGFAVPTLNQDATLTFEVQVAGLDPATQAEFLAALNAGRATLATRGDAPGDTYQAFPLCGSGQFPTAGGCVSVERLDSNGQPTNGTPAIVRFTGVTGHFSDWAVATVTADPQPEPQPEPLAVGDTAPPDTTITGGPKKKEKKGKASFSFSSTEPGSSFRARSTTAPSSPAPRQRTSRSGRASTRSRFALPTPAATRTRRRRRRAGRSRRRKEK